MKRICALVLATVIAAFSQSPLAQAWPSKTIRIVVAFAPGGSTDISTRAVADKISPALGQSVIVENRAGATGNVGAEAVVRSPADGYTFLATADALASNPHLFKMTFDAAKDLVPVVQLTRSASLPDVPTYEEAGFPGLVLDQWLGLFAPAGTPREAIQRINLEVGKALADPAIRERFAQNGLEPVGGSVEQFAKLYRDDFEKYGKLVKQLRIKVD